VGRLRALGRLLAHRPLLLFGLLLVGPAAGISLAGWRSLRSEERVRLEATEREAEDALEDRVEESVAALESIRAAEEARPYFEYQTEYLPQDTLVANWGLQRSPLTKGPQDPRVLGWFQWERGGKGGAGPPETFGPAADAWRDGLVASYGYVLTERLARARSDADLSASRETSVPLLVVKANEERGQILEETQIVENQVRQQAEVVVPMPPRSVQSDGVPNAPVQSHQVLTPYLENLLRIAGDEPVPVRSSRFQYLARAPGAAGPPLVAWRLVWIPAVHPEKRSVVRDRWLLQGYALDPGRTFPEDWEGVGGARLRRDGPDAGSPTGLHRADLARALGAEPLSPDGVADASLRLVAAPDLATVRDEGGAARQRFLTWVGGLALVVAVGFAVLLRGVRRDVALARRKEDFVAAVTHELKTPLTGIRMYAEMLREGWVPDGDAAVRYANRIIDESARLGGLVEQVLTLASLDRGLAQARLERGDLGAEVRAAVESMAPRAAQSGVALRMEVPEGLPPVPRDPKLVRPLVLNLVDNGIKYSERSPTKEVTVSLAVEGDRLVLRVADRGVGIPAKARGRLFEPFQRAQDELTRTAPGVGIGLALVRRYADAHGAKVSLDSEEGVGTTVAVRFPL
jgi:signal transduction histidine kinase